MTTITVPAVAAALLTVPRDCETCGNSRWQRNHGPGLVGSGRTAAQRSLHEPQQPDCPDCRNVCEWVACDQQVKVGSTVHIVAGPVDEHRSDVAYARAIGSWVVLHGNDDIPLRPGVVVATGVVAECVPIYDVLALAKSDLSHCQWPNIQVGQAGSLSYVQVNYFNPFPEESVNLDDQRLDQDWSPTRPCPDPSGHLTVLGLGAYTANCPTCDGAGTLPRYAIRLTDVEARP
jgi:hypothetical protein